MRWQSTVKAMQAAEKRQQRDAQKRLRELERQAKEQAKLSAIEQARLEVETYENRLEVLLSVHKEQGEVWDWAARVAALPPPVPRRFSRHEIKTRQHAELLRCLRTYGQDTKALAEACAEDERDFQMALKTHSDAVTDTEEMRVFARRILSGDKTAYTEALVEFSGLTEISDLGSSVHFTVHGTKLVECTLKVNGQQIIPAEQKSLTAAGKLSVKAMPKGRFHEIYQDHVCSCVIRVAREIFALLPVEMVLVTAAVDTIDSRSGQTLEQPVLSVAFGRTAFQRLVFDQLDPSDAIETFLHRGDAKASRKSGEFETICPLTPEDLPQTETIDAADYRDLLAKAQRLRLEFITAASPEESDLVSRDAKPSEQP